MIWISVADEDEVEAAGEDVLRGGVQVSATTLRGGEVGAEMVEATTRRRGGRVGD